MRTARAGIFSRFLAVLTVAHFIIRLRVLVFIPGL